MRRVILVPGDARDLGDHDITAQLTDVVDRAGADGATAVVVEAEPATDDFAAAVESAGFEPTRTTLQLRRPLPVEAAARGHAPTIVTRPFEPGRDDDAWLAVNNRAFAWHPDQSDQTVDDLRRNRAEPWFRADGFLLHDVRRGAARRVLLDEDPRPTSDPPLGEIYVIGVDPDRPRPRPRPRAGAGRTRLAARPRPRPRACSTSRPTTHPPWSCTRRWASSSTIHTAGGAVPSDHALAVRPDRARPSANCSRDQPRYRVDQVWQGLYAPGAAPRRADQRAQGGAGRAWPRPRRPRSSRWPSRSATTARPSSGSGAA